MMIPVTIFKLIRGLDKGILSLLSLLILLDDPLRHWRNRQKQDCIGVIDFNLNIHFTALSYL
jgi:hypothetical protein